MGRLHGTDFQALFARHPQCRPRTYIETGTRWGTQMQIAAAHFDRLYGVELNEHCYNVSRETLADVPHARMYHGDSRDWLPVLLDQTPAPCCILLDAHYCRVKPPIAKSEFPLWDELKIIRERRQADIVVVDDVHTFGKSRTELKFTPDAVEWEAVTRESLLAFFGARVLDADVIGDGFAMWLRAA